tara:strand:- start:40 stop:573 length:534 start_codon:yes stop_codon:yes gene_type:complete
MTGMFIKKLMEKGFTKGAQMLSGQGKTTGKEVISSVPIAKNIDTKKAIEQKVVKTVDKAFKDAGAPPSIANKQAKSKLKKEEGKKLKSISYRLDKLQEKVEKKAKGGRVGLKRGTNLMNKKSDIQKIKETFSPKKSAAKKSTKFGMLSVKAGIDKNPNPTQADRIAGAKMKNKKRFV